MFAIIYKMYLGHYKGYIRAYGHCKSLQIEYNMNEITESDYWCSHLQCLMQLSILKQHCWMHSGSGITYKYLPVCFSISPFWSAACTSPFVCFWSTVCTRRSIFSTTSSLSPLVNRVTHVTPDNWNGITYFICNYIFIQSMRTTVIFIDKSTK